jgi:signal transduction histidine kinase
VSRASASGPASELQQLYLAALRKHLTGVPQKSLRAAGKLGRQAVADGLGTPALARIHKRALMELVSSDETARVTNGKITRAKAFFTAALAPIDKTHRAAAEKNGALDQLNKTIRQRTAELTRAERQLKQQLVRRKALEAALKKSERERARVLEKSSRTQEQLRRLAHQLLAVQEEERRRISRELHDEIGQTLTAINVKLATLRKEATINAKAFAKTVSSTQKLVAKSMHAVHRFARDLRPPLLDDLGLIPALHTHLKEFTKRTGAPVRFTIFAGVEQLALEKRTVLFRVAQEALANVSRHAKASRVSLTIKQDEDLVRMEIHDNGKAFDVKRRLGARRNTRLGLLGMRERLEMVGGSFEIESEPAAGTTIRATIPFVTPKQAKAEGRRRGR